MIITVYLSKQEHQTLNILVIQAPLTSSISSLNMSTRKSRARTARLWFSMARVVRELMAATRTEKHSSSSPCTKAPQLPKLTRFTRVVRSIVKFIDLMWNWINGNLINYLKSKLYNTLHSLYPKGLISKILFALQNIKKVIKLIIITNNLPALDSTFSLGASSAHFLPELHSPDAKRPA